MDVNTISNNSLDIQTTLLNGINAQNRTNNGYDIKGKTAEYAKKGEPMYMEEMDSDGDGVVTLDEFRDYCKSKGINSRDMVKMSKMASAYRTMQSENEVIDYISKLTPNISPKLKQTDSSSANTTNKFNISNDVNNEKIVSYKDYMEYCAQNISPYELNNGTKFEETENGNLKITNAGKSVESYIRSQRHILENTFETEV